MIETIGTVVAIIVIAFTATYIFTKYFKYRTDVLTNHNAYELYREIRCSLEAMEKEFNSLDLRVKKWTEMR